MVKQIHGGEPLHTSIIECRLKGKVLKTEVNYYNPVAPGDIVEYDADNFMITSLAPRKNFFTRYNIKGKNTQILAANIDMVVCVTSPLSPPFRPRFIDRVLLQAELAGTDVIIAVNKSDLVADADAGAKAVEERLADYTRIGYRVLRVSAKTSMGIDALRALLAGKMSVFTGQSGTGKSSLINALLPGAVQKTGALNEKYDRGNHTTVQSELLTSASSSGSDSISIIDTPGLRQLMNGGIDADEVARYMKEFAAPSLGCAFGHSCTHTVEEGCKIQVALKSGEIHADRYESFLRITRELAERRCGKYISI
jgi:ribosome biogenesis GTPase